jgi:NTP pyrophosphatase (non-canonical NTP hydrolase)
MSQPSSEHPNKSDEFFDRLRAEALADYHGIPREQPSSEHEQSATWPYVLAFAREMEVKLAANRHKGDREGWARESTEWLMTRLREEVAELQAQLPYRVGVRSADDSGWESRGSPRGIREEAADVANFAMMIADVGGGLKP